MNPFKSIINVGMNDYGEVVKVTVEYDSKRELHMTGECRRGKNAISSCGQIKKPEFVSYSPWWDQKKVDQLWEIWDRWHLNHMKAGCEHQEAVLRVNPELEESYDALIQLSQFKNCTSCGYAYGSAWRKEEVPIEVLEWLSGLE